MKKQSSRILTKFKYPLILLLALTLLLNAAMLSGCELGGETTKEPENAETPRTGETPENAEAPEETPAETPEEPQLDENTVNYAVDRLLKNSQNESIEFLAKSLRGNFHYPVYDESAHITFKNGTIFILNKSYINAEYVKDKQIDWGPQLSLIIEALGSVPPELSEPMLDAVRNRNEYYVLTASYNNAMGEAIVLSIEDTVYVLRVSSGTPMEIYAFNVNSEYIPTVPSDDKYNGEKNYLIKSIFGKATEDPQEFYAPTFIQSSFLSWMYSLDVKIENKDTVCLNDIKYNSVVYKTDHEISLADGIRSSASSYIHKNADKSYNAMMETLDKLEAIGEYYVLTNESDEGYGSPLLLCSIGDTCFLLAIDSYSGTVIRIHSFTVE